MNKTEHTIIFISIALLVVIIFGIGIYIAVKKFLTPPCDKNSYKRYSQFNNMCGPQNCPAGSTIQPIKDKSGNITDLICCNGSICNKSDNPNFQKCMPKNLCNDPCGCPSWEDGFNNYIKNIIDEINTFFIHSGSYVLINRSYERVLQNISSGKESGHSLAAIAHLGCGDGKDPPNPNITIKTKTSKLEPKISIDTFDTSVFKTSNDQYNCNKYRGEDRVMLYIYNFPLDQYLNPRQELTQTTDCNDKFNLTSFDTKYTTTSTNNSIKNTINALKYLYANVILKNSRIMLSLNNSSDPLGRILLTPKSEEDNVYWERIYPKDISKLDIDKFSPYLTRQQDNVISIRKDIDNRIKDFTKNLSQFNTTGQLSNGDYNYIITLLSNIYTNGILSNEYINLSWCFYGTQNWITGSYKRHSTMKNSSGEGDLQILKADNDNGKVDISTQQALNCLVSNGTIQNWNCNNFTPIDNDKIPCAAWRKNFQDNPLVNDGNCSKI